MNVKKALQIQQVLDGKAIPIDMFDEHLVYYSKSRDRWINIIDMDICHLVRSFAKVYNEMNHLDGHSIETNEEVKIANDQQMEEYNQMIINKIMNIFDKRG